ncbi:hypothetical protein [Amycolatopsis nigrescens]|uniref:hypothetical protein n=1 Tax=Amycolatopsis nigrescens TaxID=381445 RepID=UPI000382CA45|nr:hypothetical protein [Amycolatopsis nigrescens]
MASKKISPASWNRSAVRAQSRRCAWLPCGVREPVGEDAELATHQRHDLALG